MTTPARTATVAPTDPVDDVELVAHASHGPFAVWGDARVSRRGEPIDWLLPGEILVVDELTTDLLGFLPTCAGVVIESAGPWEGAIPGIVHDDFARSGAAALLRALGIPHAWNVPGASESIATGNLVRIDPTTRTVWAMSFG